MLKEAPRSQHDHSILLALRVMQGSRWWLSAPKGPQTGDVKRTQDDHCLGSLPQPEGSQPRPKTHSMQHMSCLQDLHGPPPNTLLSTHKFQTVKKQECMAELGPLQMYFPLVIIILHAHLTENDDLLAGFGGHI